MIKLFYHGGNFLVAIISKMSDTNDLLLELVATKKLPPWKKSFQHH